MVSTRSRQITCLLVTLLLTLRVHAITRMQPIGIDLGPELVTAAYAYDTDNVTIISAVNPDVDNPYRDIMLRLQLLYSQEHPSPFTKNKPATSGTVKAAKSAVRSIVSTIEPYLPYLHDVGLPPWLGGAMSMAIRTISTSLESADRYLIEPVPPEDIKREFARVLRQAKEYVETKHDIKIQSAFFSSPSFFNSTLNNLVVEAAKEVGIRASTIVLPRSIAVTYAYDSGRSGGKGIRYLIIDQGEYHCDLHTAHMGEPDDEYRIKEVFFPMEPFSSANINRRIAEKLIGESKDMKNQVAWGAKRGDLWQPIKKARFLIRDEIESEIMGEEEFKPEHLDEYPLDLMNWGDGSVQAVLKWGDVQKEENEYVDALASNIKTVLVALRGWRNQERQGTSVETETPEEVDRVVILTTHYDGQLIKRAVQSVFGESVEVIGGTVRGFQLAAIGASYVALATHRTKTWAKPGSSEKHDEL